MCGIIGYTGKRDALPIVLDGLRRLEYRGYDSAGVAIQNGENIRVVRAVGKVAALAKRCKGKRLAGTAGIGHTRWATHGKPSEKNTHPHSDCTKSFFIRRIPRQLAAGMGRGKFYSYGVVTIRILV